MADLNSFSCTGRLTKDAMFRSPAGKDLLSFSVAVNGFKDGDVIFLDCTLWGKPAVALKDYLLRGKQVALNGKLKQETWEKDGVVNKKLALTVNDVNLIGGTKPPTEPEDITY